jgi:hypothetical protein
LPIPARRMASAVRTANGSIPLNADCLAIKTPAF